MDAAAPIKKVAQSHLAASDMGIHMTRKFKKIFLYVFEPNPAFELCSFFGMPASV